MAGPLRTLAIAMAIVLVALLASRQLGAGYAPHHNYRAQTAAFLEGRLALTPSPDGLAHDLAWTASGVQQVWGLGVPAWQTPFELLGRAVGVTPFPDRVALFAWLALALCLSMRGFRDPERPGGAWVSAGTVLVVAGLPAFVALLRGRLGVYEEAAAYSYAAAVMMLGALAAFARRPTAAAYVAIAAFAGLGGFIRPTVWFYGLATLVVATGLWIRSDAVALRSWRPRLAIAALAVGLFVAGGAALYATNAARFGTGTEFGHRLNVHSLPGNIIATRFSYPFADLSLAEASAELFGGLFDRPELSAKRSGFYQTGLHLGEQGTPRWREFYFTTYRWAYAPLLLAGMLFGALAWRRASARDRDTRWLAAWAAIGLGPLIWFYLWSPSISSRYQLDLGPGFAALLAIAWRTVVGRLAPLHARHAFAALVVIWAVAVATSKVNRTRAARTIDVAAASTGTARLTHPPTFARDPSTQLDAADAYVATHTDVIPFFERCHDATGAPLDCSTPPSIGDTYVRGTRDDLGWTVSAHVVPEHEPMLACPVDDGGSLAAPRLESSDGTCMRDGTIDATALFTTEVTLPPSLYLNASGWDLETGRVPPATHFFVDSPQFIELDLAYAPTGEPNRRGYRPSPNTTESATEWTTESTTAVRVAIGLAHLRLVSLQSTYTGARLRFEPTRRLPDGLHVAFVAFGPDFDLDRETSDFLLHAIRWR